MARRKLNPRKLLIASTGVATLSYLAATPGCGAKARHSTVANLMAVQTMGDGGTPSTEPGPGPDPSPTVANLVAPVDPTTIVANLPAPPVMPTSVVANLPAPPVMPTSIVANLPAPPVMPMPTMGPIEPTSIVANLPAPPDPNPSGGAPGIGGQGNNPTGGAQNGGAGGTGVPRSDAGAEMPDAQAPRDAAVDTSAGGNR